MRIDIIGAGLAGCEAAWQAANMGVRVRLFEMKPEKFTPAHSQPLFAELVCSNSLKSDRIENASGLLKKEMRLLGSIIISAADAARVPAGGALAVDREAFSSFITEKIKNHPLIEIVTGEVTSIPQSRCIVATGPLTSDELAEHIEGLTGEQLYFYDAAAPIVYADTINLDRAFKASRYGRGSDYINCPLDRQQYDAFYNELINAESVQMKGFEDSEVFEGCMPVEVMAKRGYDTLRFGPMRPVGITCPDNTRPFAVVQLRQDNAADTLYNIVGFQTHLTFSEQKRVFRLIPGLENAEFARYGVMHRNTYINSPKLLDKYY
ncbi:MAG TPA: methylenetetrahydrofolate--tRNA-(uracil(54)-C(5))-methyltransferase (FADH(2)-oxidizing) TrmFO, partial [Clostridia bacterium]|nr:methylenetetrahydrofolate--tRNA-(uracil(54)-C(5))-methyltransferase (FADH(2)-oxidizing) TrmFO [Clostridia bacterium]